MSSWEEQPICKSKLAIAVIVLKSKAGDIRTHLYRKLRRFTTATRGLVC
jgi:hypothetical protein